MSLRNLPTCVVAAALFTLVPQPVLAEADPYTPAPAAPETPATDAFTLPGQDMHAAVRAFYETRAHAPVWHDGTAWLPLAATALKVVQGAAAHGLQPADYLPPASDSLLAAPPTDGAEVALTTAVLKYLRDVTGGRIPPADRPGHRYPHGLPDTPKAAASHLGEALAAPDPGAALAAVRPDHPQYGRLMDLLADLRQERSALGSRPRIAEGPSIRPGESDPRVPDIRAALVRHGDLSPMVAAWALDETTFDPVVEAALRDFQERHGITVDGIVGPDTLKSLNAPLDRRIDQVIANLERLRWDPAPPAFGKFVEVNVPDYRLTAYEDGEPVLTSRVVVGTTKNKTPLFTDYMDDVVLNPTWTVPRSIAAEEILPQLRANPGYVYGRDMEIRASWSHSAPRVDPYAVDWWSVNGRSMPYMFVQQSGPGNALGRVRFSLNNDFAIYMHDTPSKSLFGRPHRAFSHGCMRVQDVDGLLAFVAGADYSSIQRRLASGRTMTVRLPQPVDARVVYHTVWVDDAGTVNVRRDVYGNDEDVLQRLQEEGRQLIALEPQATAGAPVER